MDCNLFNKSKNESLTCKVGFCWTFLFLGFWAPAFRKDWLFVWVSIIVILISSLFQSSFRYHIYHSIGIDISVVGGYNIVMSFIYNRIYIKRMMKRGFLPASEADKKILKSRNYI